MRSRRFAIKQTNETPAVMSCEGRAIKYDLLCWRSQRQRTDFRSLTVTESEGLSEKPGSLPEHLKGTLMRAILAVAITATLVLVAWWNYSTSADAGPNVAKSIDPTVMTLKAPDMPQYVGP
jgi:hypothetical protein